MNTSARILAAVLALTAFAATSVSSAEPSIRIDGPYARATVPGQPAGGGYLKIRNTGAQADRLVAVEADVSKSVELHSMSMDGDVMRMRQVEGIDLPAGKTVELKPGGLHVMFVGLKAPFKTGDQVPVTLRFQKAGPVKVSLPVQAANASAGDDGHHGAHHDHKH